MLMSLVVSAVLSFGDPYCNGYEAGFEAGYCQNRGVSCIAPPVLTCPTPKTGQYSYQDGYNRGFLAGMSR